MNRWVCFHQVDVERPHESCWTQPRYIPTCLKSCLRNVKLLGFRSLDHDLELVKYILKNAEVLTKLEVYTGLLSDFEENFRILKKFSEFPRGSKKCELFFSKVQSLSHEFFIDLYFIMITNVYNNLPTTLKKWSYLTGYKLCI